MHRVRALHTTGGFMWILDIIELIIDACNPFTPHAGLRQWLVVTLIVCVLIGLGAYFWN